MTAGRLTSTDANPGEHHRGQGLIALGALAGIGLHLLLRFGLPGDDTYLGIRLHDWPLLTVLVLGGVPLVAELAGNVLRLEFGADLLAGISIVMSVLLGEYLAGALVVLMLSGGEALESYAVRSASSVLRALAQRMPSLAHRRQNGEMVDVPLSEVAIGDTLVLFPHDACPVDGIVTEGRGVMDESFLTGEPFQMSKTPGSEVISGAINGESALTIRATRPAADSRYAKIMKELISSPPMPAASSASWSSTTAMRRRTGSVTSLASRGFPSSSI